MSLSKSKLAEIRSKFSFAKDLLLPIPKEQCAEMHEELLSSASMLYELVDAFSKDMELCVERLNQDREVVNALSHTQARGMAIIGKLINAAKAIHNHSKGMTSKVLSNSIDKKKHQQLMAAKKAQLAIIRAESDSAENEYFALQEQIAALQNKMSVTIRQIDSRRLEIAAEEEKEQAEAAAKVLELEKTTEVKTEMDEVEEEAEESMEELMVATPPRSVTSIKDRVFVSMGVGEEVEEWTPPTPVTPIRVSEFIPSSSTAPIRVNEFIPSSSSSTTICRQVATKRVKENVVIEPLSKKKKVHYKNKDNMETSYTIDSSFWNDD